MHGEPAPDGYRERAAALASMHGDPVRVETGTAFDVCNLSGRYNAGVAEAWWYRSGAAAAAFTALRRFSARRVTIAVRSYDAGVLTVDVPRGLPVLRDDDSGWTADAIERLLGQRLSPRRCGSCG